MPTLYLEQWEMESLTGRLDKNGNPVVYKVSLANDGHYECSCPSWIFQRKYLIDGRRIEPWETANGHCKHIVEVIAGRTAYREDLEAGRPVKYQTPEYRVELCDNGRVAGLLRGMSSE